jgi:hypothetical protein
MLLGGRRRSEIGNRLRDTIRNSGACPWVRQASWAQGWFSVMGRRRRIASISSRSGREPRWARSAWRTRLPTLSAWVSRKAADRRFKNQQHDQGQATPVGDKSSLHRLLLSGFRFVGYNQPLTSATGQGDLRCPPTNNARTVIGW